MGLRKWIKETLLGSVEYQATVRLNRHLQENTSLARRRYSLPRRYLERFFRPKVTGLVMAYLIIILMFLVDEALLKALYPSFQKDIAFNFFGAESDLLSTQVTALALIFPIALSLVTIILQRNETSHLDADIRLYNRESLAAPIGASCITLIIILCLNRYFSLDGAVKFIGNISSGDYFARWLNNSHVQMFIPIITIWWLSVNLLALWHFLKISLAYVQPASRSLLRQEYAANVLIPRDIKSMLRFNIYYSARERYLNLNDNDIRIIFGYGYDTHQRAVSRTLEGSYILEDVWSRPLCLFLKGWLSRAGRTTVVRHHSLYFPLRVGDSYSGEVCLCELNGDTPLTKTERLAIYHCFRFRKV